MMMNIKKRKIKIEPRIKLSYNMYKCKTKNRCPITAIQLQKSCNWIAVIGHSFDRAPISNSNWTEWREDDLKLQA